MDNNKEILKVLALFIPGIIGILILKYTHALNFLEHHLDFDIAFMLLVLLFLEFMVVFFRDEIKTLPKYKQI
jgi:Ca2+/Na+ antiporter